MDNPLSKVENAWAIDLARAIVQYQADSDQEAKAAMAKAQPFFDIGDFAFFQQILRESPIVPLPTGFTKKGLDDVPEFSFEFADIIVQLADYIKAKESDTQSND